MFARGARTADIAKELRVSERSVEQWRRNWREGGVEGLKSKGPAKLPKLSDERFALLEKELAKGPAAHGFEDQRWTLERVRALIGRQFRISCSIAGVWRLLHRHGWSWQSPARRALERDEHAVELWKKEVWPQVEGQRRRSMPGSSSSCAVRRCVSCGGERPSPLTCRSREVELRAA